LGGGKEKFKIRDYEFLKQGTEGRGEKKRRRLSPESTSGSDHFSRGGDPSLKQTHGVLEKKGGRGGEEIAFSVCFLKGEVKVEPGFC